MYNIYNLYNLKNAIFPKTYYIASTFTLNGQKYMDTHFHVHFAAQKLWNSLPLTVKTFTIFYNCV